jgi:hypothetical protein
MNLIETLVHKKQYTHPILHEWVAKRKKATGKSRSSILLQIQKRLQYRTWAEKNHDDILAKQRARYYADHEATKAKRRISTKKYYKANKAKLNEQRKKWGRENGKHVYQLRQMRESEETKKANRDKSKIRLGSIAYTCPETGKTMTWRMVYYHRMQLKKIIHKLIFITTQICLVKQ